MYQGQSFRWIHVVFCCTYLVSIPLYYCLLTHYSCEIEDFVAAHILQAVCDIYQKRQGCVEVAIDRPGTDNPHKKQATPLERNSEITSCHLLEGSAKTSAARRVYGHSWTGSFRRHRVRDMRAPVLSWRKSTTKTTTTRGCAIFARSTHTRAAVEAISNLFFFDEKRFCLAGRFLTQRTTLSLQNATGYYRFVFETFFFLRSAAGCSLGSTSTSSQYVYLVGGHMAPRQKCIRILIFFRRKLFFFCWMGLLRTSPPNN